MRLKKYSCTFVVAARFGDRKQPSRGSQLFNASASTEYFTSRGNLVTRLELRLDPELYRRVKILLGDNLRDTLRIVSGELEVAYCEQAQESAWTDRGKRNRYKHGGHYFKALGWVGERE